MESLEERVRSLIMPILEREGVELVDLEIKGHVGNQVLKVFVDEVGGISLDRCAYLSREISDILDIEDPIPGRYRLEVSSPGVDRPLKTARDFERNVGREVRVDYEQDGNRVRVEGTIEAVVSDRLTLQVESGSVEIPIEAIRLAKRKLKW
jgi:ribosome maturation factor RimP